MADILPLFAVIEPTRIGRHHAVARIDWPFLLPLAAMVAVAVRAVSFLFFAI